MKQDGVSPVRCEAELGVVGSRESVSIDKPKVA